MPTVAEVIAEIFALLLLLVGIVCIGILGNYSSSPRQAAIKYLRNYRQDLEDIDPDKRDITLTSRIWEIEKELQEMSDPR